MIRYMSLGCPLSGSTASGPKRCMSRFTSEDLPSPPRKPTRKWIVRSSGLSASMSMNCCCHLKGSPLSGGSRGLYESSSMRSMPPCIRANSLPWSLISCMRISFLRSDGTCSQRRVSVSVIPMTSLRLPCSNLIFSPKSQVRYSTQGVWSQMASTRLS
nr:MAG: hypothetical protein [Chemarfal virus 38]